MSDSPRINIPNVILLSKELTSTSSIVITRNHTKRPFEDNVDVEHLNPKRLKFTEQSGTPPLGSLKELNKRKKSERCNHCLRSDHVRITSINCLRNPKNPNYNLFQKTVETPINAHNFDSNEMFEYTINTQSSVPTQSVSSSHTQNSPLFITNTSRVRTPLQQQQKNYLNEFNSKKNGLHQQNWVNEKLKKFHNEMDDLKQFFCENCHELWPSKINHCTQCSIDNVKYSKLNDMVPGIDELDPETKKAFEDLTVVEEILISPILVIMSVNGLPGGALSSRGFCANFSQDIQAIVTLLPRLTQNIPLLILKKKDQKNSTRHFVVNKRRVLICLNYLFKNNPQYIAHNIRIDEEALNLLPQNSVPESLREFECLDNDLTIEKGPELNENNENLDIDDDFNNTYVEEDDNQILLDDQIKNAINFPNASQNTLNEYQNDSICSLAFPKLFPNGAGDPTKKARLKEVTESLAFKHLMKSAAKSYKNCHFYYAWAKHQRFKFWAYDRLRRHRSLDQCKVFFKHNVHEANLSMNQLKSMINTPESNLLMKKMSTYSANITGSDAYYYPDHHWEELHNLMPGLKANLQSQKYKNLMDNPHLVDWFFSYRLNEFLKVVFDDILDCDWRWHRYEWQSRSSIHAHGAVKFKNDPDLVKLTTELYIGRLAEKKIENKQYDSEEVYNQLINDVKKGKESEELVINYTDTLITAMNPKTNFAENCVPTPHPCSIKTSNINIDNLENDYKNLINCCQRHVCRINGYCKSKVSGKCRFTYPFELQEKTKINFIETKDSVKAEIVLLRNDPWMNMHNRIICHNWRGNVDMQIILDKSAAIKYMVKYATKGEKAEIEDNPSTKMRSLMVKSIAGKRDIGQCEVSRLLLSEPLYNSLFNYVTISTEIDSRELNLNVNDDNDSPATKNSLIDYYANRKQIDLIKNQLVKIDNLVSFVKYFKLDNKNKLSIRTEHEKTVVITLPKIRYNPDNTEMYKIYCYHHTIKYSDWDISNINEIRNKNTAIERWNNFLRNASSEILEMIGFTTELSKQLKEARKEIELDPETQLTRDQWMSQY
ncbi:ATP-dependent DNA helicase PIF1 [Brachionus plicatilis]|uniref:ATP-dependent DNA helicase PIF1 n=1 Tax=Brachionus plicatilis TaxID=10195 RepID=A0A3M7QY79_BRAPC|nr:ATP-dependent DNA helicase PIF1 [Brachionus plicatilis]